MGGEPPVLQIDPFREKINDVLAPCLNGRCVLLGLPNYPNVGDHLIWEGTRRFLTQCEGVELTYEAPGVFFDPSYVHAGDTIVLSGGGNFGDLYIKQQAFRDHIVRLFPAHPIVLLPQTVFFSDASRMTQTAEAFVGHSQLTLCARDHESFKLFKTYFDAHDVRLVPDMAFCLDWGGCKVSQGEQKKLLFMLRGDKESRGYHVAKEFSDADCADWPTLDSGLWRYFLKEGEQGVERLVHMVLKWVNRINGPMERSYPYRLFRKHALWIEEGVNFLSRYDLVVTDRLHGHIASILLGIPSVLLDNSYGKNKHFYETWLRGVSGSRFVSNESELHSCIAEMLNV